MFENFFRRKPAPANVGGKTSREEGDLRGLTGAARAEKEKMISDAKAIIGTMNELQLKQIAKLGTSHIINYMESIYDGMVPPSPTARMIASLVQKVKKTDYSVIGQHELMIEITRIIVERYGEEKSV